MPSKSSVKRIDRVYELFCDVRSTLDAENWSQQLKVFLSEFSTFTGTDFEERIFSGWIAAICEQAYYTTAHGTDSRTRKEFEKEIKKGTRVAK